MQKIKLLFILSLLMVFVLSACGPGGDGEPTLSVEQIQTLAVMTYQAQLTQTAMAMPTVTFTPRPTETPITIVTFAPPGGTSSAPTSTPASSGGSSACYGLAYVKDVTIPDNTEMAPGQSFTKTWLVSNTGSCDWEPGFIFNIVGGDAMSGVAVTLNQVVQPGRQYEFSVPMIAPTDKTGEVKGTWRLSDANNNFFGDGVYVLIKVGNGPTATPTETATTTP